MLARRFILGLGLGLAGLLVPCRTFGSSGAHVPHFLDHFAATAKSPSAEFAKAMTTWMFAADFFNVINAVKLKRARRLFGVPQVGPDQCDQAYGIFEAAVAAYPDAKSFLISFASEVTCLHFFSEEAARGNIFDSSYCRYWLQSSVCRQLESIFYSKGICIGLVVDWNVPLAELEVRDTDWNKPLAAGAETAAAQAMLETADFNQDGVVQQEEFRVVACGHNAHGLLF